jgi:hypothetical protein
MEAAMTPGFGPIGKVREKAAEFRRGQSLAERSATADGLLNTTRESVTENAATHTTEKSRFYSIASLRLSLSSTAEEKKSELIRGANLCIL